MDDAQKRYTGRCDCLGVLDVNVPENQERVDDWRRRHTEAGHRVRRETLTDLVTGEVVPA
jgi:hypothetical protein